MAYSGCVHCSCAEFRPRLHLGQKPEEPPTPPEEDEIEQYLNEMDPMPPLAAGLVSLIESGHLDRYLELILNSAHNRKRTMRGAAGFKGRSRRG